MRSVSAQSEKNLLKRRKHWCRANWHTLAYLTYECFILWLPSQHMMIYLSLTMSAIFRSRRIWGTTRSCSGPWPWSRQGSFRKYWNSWVYGTEGGTNVGVSFSSTMNLQATGYLPDYYTASDNAPMSYQPPPPPRNVPATPIAPEFLAARAVSFS